MLDGRCAAFARDDRFKSLDGHALRGKIGDVFGLQDRDFVGRLDDFDD